MSDPTVQQWLVVVAAFLTGLLVKWLLDLFLLRRRFFETRARLAAVEQQLTAARHEHSRTAESLKNRLVELDATSKAKLAGEALAARRGREVESLQEELAAARARCDLLENRGVALEQLSTEFRFGRDSAEAAAAEARSEILDLRLRQAVHEARITGQDQSLSELRAIRESLIRERDEVFDRCLGAEAALAGQRSANQALVDAVSSRDTTLAGLRSHAEGLEAELRSVSELLASRDNEVARLTAGAGEAESLRRELAQAAAETARAKSQLESATRLRDEAQAALRRREAESAEWERKAVEYQSAFDDAARENARIGQDLSRSQAALAAALAAQGPSESARRLAESRAGELEKLLESSELRLAEAMESMAAMAAIPRTPPPAPMPAPAPTPSAPDPAVRRRIEEAEKAASLAETARITMEAELAAVSESHARLESQLAELRPLAARADDLAEKLGQVEAELARIQGAAEGGSKGDVDSVLNDLDLVTRERNELAAELALLKSKGREDT